MLLVVSIFFIVYIIICFVIGFLLKNSIKNMYYLKSDVAATLLGVVIVCVPSAIVILCGVSLICFIYSAFQFFL